MGMKFHGREGVSKRSWKIEKNMIKKKPPCMKLSKKN